jgi:very-short-patch-repair endonuclease
MAYDKFHRIKELNGYKSKRDFYNALDSWGSEYFYSRNDPPTPPIFKVLLETENHYATIELRIKPDKANPDGFKGIAEEIKTLFGYEVVYIRKTDEKGLTNYIFQREIGLPLPTDSDFESRIKIIFNARDLFSIVYSKDKDFNTPIREVNKKILKFFKTFFLDSLGREIKPNEISASWSPDYKKYNLKTKQHSFYNVPHMDSVGSPIEDKLKIEFEKLKIPFKVQQEIMFEGQKFSVPDFLIENPLIAIYCDGTEFHKDTEKIIKDKQQDRILQQNEYLVLRFSGSEIHSNAYECAIEVLKTISKFKKT